MDGVRGDIMQELDWGIGEMMKELKEAGVADNTLVIFTSDNGPTKNEYALPYRGTKYVTLEGGHRVPFILHWPAKLKEPRVIDTGIHAMDLFPTLSEIIGATLPADRTYDGESLVPLLQGDSLTRSRDAPFYYYNCENLQAIRQGNWKIHFPRQAKQVPFWEKNKAFFRLEKPVLYHLATDPGESKDAADQHPELILKFEGMAKDVRLALGEYRQRGSEQRPTGTAIEGAPIVPSPKDWVQIDSEWARRIAEVHKARRPETKKSAKPKEP
jgi:arylsulfatase A-like enzyme